jgi:Zn-dependent peptidase ImmA (M78 family)
LSAPTCLSLIRDQWFIWINAYHSPRRRRWTIGHELGHIALNHQGIVFLFNGGCEAPHQTRSANRFSAELLMPEDLVLRERSMAVEAGLSVGDLADIFLVDKRVAELRLEEMHLEL